MSDSSIRGSPKEQWDELEKINKINLVFDRMLSRKRTNSRNKVKFNKNMESVNKINKMFAMSLTFDLSILDQSSENSYRSLFLYLELFSLNLFVPKEINRQMSPMHVRLRNERS